MRALKLEANREIRALRARLEGRETRQAEKRTLLAVRELAERWGMASSSIRRRIADGRIPAIGIGGVVRISIAWVLEQEELARYAYRDEPEEEKTT